MAGSNIKKTFIWAFVVLKARESLFIIRLSVALLCVYSINFNVNKLVARVLPSGGQIIKIDYLMFDPNQTLRLNHTTK